MVGNLTSLSAHLIHLTDFGNISMWTAVRAAPTPTLWQGNNTSPSLNCRGGSFPLILLTKCYLKAPGGTGVNLVSSAYTASAAWI